MLFPAHYLITYRPNPKKGCIVSLMAQFYRPEISSAFRVEIVGVDHALNRNLVRILADQIISKNLGILETSRSKIGQKKTLVSRII